MSKALNPSTADSSAQKERSGFGVSQADKIQRQREVMWACRHTGYQA